MKRITSTLSINSMVRFYIFPSESEVSEIFPGVYDRIQEQLYTYTLAFDYIDSIYVYSPYEKTVIRSTIKTNSRDIVEPLHSLNDISWLPYIDHMDSSIYFIPRAVNGIYPYVLTVLHRFQVGSEVGYIILNIDLKSMPVFLDTNNTELSSAYILTNNGQVLYRPNKRALLEDISQFPELELFDSDAEHLSSICGQEQKFIYTQVESQNYDWHYIVITHLQEYTRRLSQLQFILTVIFSLLLLFFAGFSLLLSMDLYRPIRKLVALLDNPKNWNAAEGRYNADIRRIAEHITSYIQKNTDLSIELKKQIGLLNDTQIWALQSQINPHFIFNTLNQIHLEAVQSLGYSSVVSRMIVTFGKIMQYALEPENLVSLSREVEYTNLFISILSECYENRILAEFDLDDRAMETQVPRLLLQPVIENSIRHGMGGNPNQKLKILIRTKFLCADDTVLPYDSVIITIKDTGAGIDPTTLKELQSSLADTPMKNDKHIGLKNIAMRLRLLFLEQAAIQIESIQGEGTTVTLKLPFSPSKPFQ